MFCINKKLIGHNNPVYVIAELGINYNGNVDIALKMVEEASRSGADAVKLQIITADKSYTADSASYSIFKKNELPLSEWRKIVEFGKVLGIDVFSTFVNTFDLAYVEELNLPAIKISSTNITNFPLLEAIARTGKPVIMSTGMGYLSEVDEAVRFMENKGQQQIAILHCTSLYPTPSENVHLRAIQTLAAVFPRYPIGYSDHTMGISCGIGAVACGASIIEKHFTLDRKMDGPDHHFSATPKDFSRLVQAIREIELALGSPEKRPTPDEIPLRDQLQRSLVAVVDIAEGEPLDAEKIIPKRSPIKGIAPQYFHIVAGRIARKPIPKDTPITWDLI